jgi:RNase P/RNase MRP subunit POP5
MQEILRDELDDEEFLEFAIENYSEIFGYIATGKVNIRVHRDVTDEMWFGLG